MAPKRLQLLHELVPTASVIALLVNPSPIPLLLRPTRRRCRQRLGRSGWSSIS